MSGNELVRFPEPRTENAISSGMSVVVLGLATPEGQIESVATINTELAFKLLKFTTLACAGLALATAYDQAFNVKEPESC